MPQDNVPPTPYEPPWWDGISFPPAGHKQVTMVTRPTPSTGAAAVRATLHGEVRPPWRNPTAEMITDVRSSSETIGGSTPAHLVAYVTIGNSDDKLEQHDWSNFIRELRAVLSDYPGRTYGEWFSAPDSTWQNMCICKEIHQSDLDKLRAALRALRAFYRQDSVALVTSTRTELV